MNTEITLKLKAFALALLMNGIVLGGTVVLFDAQMHRAVAGSMIGEVGALGGGFIPNAMGLSKQYSGSYLWGFVSFAVLALLMLVMLRVVQIRWTRTWAERGGRARPMGQHAPLPRAPSERGLRHG